MATAMVDVTPIYAAKHGELGVAPPVTPQTEDPGYLGPASPEKVARSIARRARIRVIATLAPLSFLVALLLVVVGQVGL